MARFQALTNAVVDAQLEQLREELGLAKSQKADLLKEMASITGWALSQARAGRAIEARLGDHVERLEHPALERLRAQGMLAGERIELYEAGLRRLGEVLDRPFRPTAGLRKALANLANPDRKPPEVRWPGPASKPSRQRKKKTWRSTSSR